MSRLTDLLHLSHVPRWTITPMSRPQSVAEHSFRAAIIAVELYNRMPYKPDFPWWEVEAWALVHDGAECKTGDIPSPLKRILEKHVNLDAIDYQLCPWLDGDEGEISPIAKAIVKLSDSLEALSWVVAYGDGARNLYDNTGAKIEDALYARILEETKDTEVKFGGRLRGLMEAVCSVIEEVAPEKLQQSVASSSSTAK